LPLCVLGTSFYVRNIILWFRLDTDSSELLICMRTCILLVIWYREKQGVLNSMEIQVP